MRNIGLVLVNLCFEFMKSPLSYHARTYRGTVEYYSAWCALYCRVSEGNERGSEHVRVIMGHSKSGTTVLFRPVDLEKKVKK